METPDTEWEKDFDEKFGWLKRSKVTGAQLYDQMMLKHFITSLLSSRDTYLKERVRKDVKDAYEHAEIVRQRTLNEIRQAVEDDESYGGAKECVYKILDRY